MGTITIQVTETGFSNATRNFTVPDTHIDRLVAAYQVAANASVNATATRAQVLNYWATSFIQETVQYVLSVEQQNAAAAATAGITPITAT